MIVSYIVFRLIKLIRKLNKSNNTLFNYIESFLQKNETKLSYIITIDKNVWEVI